MKKLAPERLRYLRVRNRLWRIQKEAEKVLKRTSPLFSLLGAPTADHNVMNHLIDSPCLREVLPEDEQTTEYWKGGGFRGFLKEGLKPRNLDDLAIANALYRPWPLATGIADAFLSRRTRSCLHPEMAPMLSATRNTIVFQEQVVEVLKRVAGFETEEAHRLRRALSRGRPEEMAPLEELFVERINKARGIPPRMRWRIVAKVLREGKGAFSRAASYEMVRVLWHQSYLACYFNRELQMATALVDGRHGDKDDMSRLVAKLRARRDLVDLVREYVPSLCRAGKYYRGLCPFHRERTASLVVDEERQIFHCFGCKRGGDIVSFMMNVDGHIPFSEAVARLAIRAGLSAE